MRCWNHEAKAVPFQYLQARPEPGRANILTVDLEDWYHGLELPVSGWAQYEDEDRVERGTNRLCELFEEAGVRGTFFVLGSLARRHPQLVKRISDRGHEIATHGYSHRFVYQQEPAQFVSELRRSIDLLEDITGHRVLGHRAAFFSITKRSLWALELLADCGLRYDSSSFPVYNDRYGMPNAPRNAFVLDYGGRKLIELPLSTVRFLGMNIPIAGGAYFRLLPYAITRAAFARINRLGRYAVFYIHPWELDPHQPRIPLPRRIALTRYCRLAQTEDRLRKLLAEFRFAPAAQVLGLEPEQTTGAIPSLCSFDLARHS